jgi:hypothetical protein
MPRPLSKRMIAEIVEGYGQAARRLKTAGLDGVEIVASHGYLPAQFLNPRVNLRDDEYGGSFENRLRFIREIVAAIRRECGDDLIVGMRISGDEKDYAGLQDGEALEAMQALDGDLDYFSIVAGSSARFGGAIHIAAPMAIEHGYVAPFAAAAKARVKTPIFVAGRINQPQDAEKILASGQTDMVGMTRALICDPEMPGKAQEGRLDDVRACIACNQACIGHFHLGYPISCIQHPETGRELVYGKRKPIAKQKRVLIAGGGPGGMKAAAVAAERGHDVTLWERGDALGGQFRLAGLQPSRGQITDLLAWYGQRLAALDVDVQLGRAASAPAAPGRRAARSLHTKSRHGRARRRPPPPSCRPARRRRR